MISSIARDATAAGAVAMNDLSMSMCDVDVSVSSCAAVGSAPTTVIFSLTVGS